MSATASTYTFTMTLFEFKKRKKRNRVFPFYADVGKETNWKASRAYRED